MVQAQEVGDVDRINHWYMMDGYGGLKSKLYNLGLRIKCFIIIPLPAIFIFFFLNDPAPPEFYPLSLPAALPIYCRQLRAQRVLSALVFAWARAGKSSPAKMAMMATTTSNSISVNAGRGICRDNGEVVIVINNEIGRAHV